jgi:CheY-like chemotaxis protein
MAYKLLLVDDDSDDRGFFADAVAQVSSEVSCITLSNGYALLPALSENGKPDIIFLDLNMPGLSGWDCLSLLKEHDSYKDIPVVMYSTSKHEE